MCVREFTYRRHYIYRRKERWHHHRDRERAGERSAIPEQERLRGRLHKHHAPGIQQLPVR